MALVTADEYGALCHMLLTYSAFEYFLRIVGVESRGTSALLSDEESDAVQRRLRALNGQAELLSTVRRHVEPRFQRQIDDHLDGRKANPFFLAAAIRHTFAHGSLTANPTGVPSRAVSTVTNYLIQVLFRVVDREFERRMIDFETRKTDG